MTEPRAPDPTLTENGNERVRLRKEGENGRPRLVAHREAWAEPGRGEAWGSYRLFCEPTIASLLTAILASDIAYQAVPCRECFPEAPTPGFRVSSGAQPERGCEVMDPHLAWQRP